MRNLNQIINVCCFFLLWLPLYGQAQQLTIVELNAENVFDTQHDSLKNDQEWLPESPRHWTRRKYWDKLNHLGQEIIACGETEDGWSLPDLVALCEIENDTTMRDLTKRSLLRKAHYEYVMTDSPDERGIDVVLLYSPFSFAPIATHSLRIEPLAEMRKTRDILYVPGRIVSGDTLHVFVVHAPSRFGGERATRPVRLHVMNRLCAAIDSIHATSPLAKMIVLGDFNDTADDVAPQMLLQHGMVNVSKHAQGHHGAKGTYKYKGTWESIDQIFVSEDWATQPHDCQLFDAPFLLEEDDKYGGVMPRRNFIGMRYNKGFSDHLPLVLRIGVHSR